MILYYISSYFIFVSCSYFRIDPSVLSDSSLSRLIRRLTDISIRGLPSIWLPRTLPQTLPLSSTSTFDTKEKKGEQSSVEIQKYTKVDDDKKCPLRQAVLTLLSSLARTPKYDEIMKNDCVSVLISYASLGTFQ